MTTELPDRSPAGRGVDLVAGLEAIIDATTGILAAQSLGETLRAMSDALASIVPYTSLAVYEVDWETRVGLPLHATGSYIEQTLASRPSLDTSITGSAVLEARVIYLEADEPVLRQHVMPGTEPSDYESMVVAPLLAGGRPYGTLNVWREAARGQVGAVQFSHQELTLLERFAALASIAYVNCAQREQLRTQALTDALTGLYNRRHFETSLAAALKEAGRHAEPTSVAYFDIDAFKSINDQFGHACGDETLRGFADVLRAHTRAGDIVCRTGGEEFTVVLPRTDESSARHLALRVCDAVRDAALGPWGTLTVSGGVASAPASLEDPEWIIQRADGALLSAKRAGRDRIVVAGAPA